MAFTQVSDIQSPTDYIQKVYEDAMFVAYLASVHADCFVGQVFPVCGGWVPR